LDARIRKERSGKQNWYLIYSHATALKAGENGTFGTLEVLGPEHEFSLVDGNLHPLPIVDTIIKELNGRIVNYMAYQSKV